MCQHLVDGVEWLRGVELPKLLSIRRRNRVEFSIRCAFEHDAGNYGWSRSKRRSASARRRRWRSKRPNALAGCRLQCDEARPTGSVVDVLVIDSTAPHNRTSAAIGSHRSTANV